MIINYGDTYIDGLTHYDYIPTTHENIKEQTEGKPYEYKAITWAEMVGAIEYYTKANEMIYYTSFPMEHMTYKCVVNLDTFKETRTPLKYYYKPYKNLVGGKTQANYCV